MTEHEMHPIRRTVSRRWVLHGLLAGGALALTGGVALVGGGRRSAFAGTRAMMGTTATILVAGRRPADASKAEAAVAAAFDRMEHVSCLMTRFAADSDIGRVNAQPERAVPVDALTARVVAAGLAYARASDGAFDPALDRLSTLWGFHGGAPPRTLPVPPLLAPWWGGGLHRSVALGDAAGRPTLRLAHREIGLDLGGIAKGFAVDEGVAELRRWGIRDAIVEAGGDLYALGHDPTGSPWPVGVRHPRDPRRLLATLRLSDEAAATSGDYEHTVTVAGRRFGHLIDPRTAWPAAWLHSATVRAESAMAADALATAACATPPARLPALLRRLEARGWLAMDVGGNTLQG